MSTPSVRMLANYCRLGSIVAVMVIMLGGPTTLAGDRQLDPLPATDHAVKVVVPPGKTMKVHVDFPALKQDPERDVSIYGPDRKRVKIFNNYHTGSGVWSLTNSTGNAQEYWVVGRFKLKYDGRWDWQDAPKSTRRESGTGWSGTFHCRFAKVDNEIYFQTDRGYAHGVGLTIPQEYQVAAVDATIE